MPLTFACRRESSEITELQEGAVYVRYGVPAVNVDTLSDFFIDELPSHFIYACSRRTIREIADEDALYAARTSKNLSLGAIASQLGVSRESIRKYEEGKGQC